MKQSVGCVYLLVNLKNGKRYVGKDKTGCPENHRWKDHLKLAFIYKDKRPLYCAMRKADRESRGASVGFSAEIIWQGPTDKLNEKEKYYIKLLHTFIEDNLGDRSYNLTLGGGEGGPLAECTKKKLRETMKCICSDLAVRGAMSKRALERFKDPVERKKLSIRESLRFSDPMERARHSVTMSKPDVRKKLSEGNRRRYKNPVEHSKTSEGNRRRYENPIERLKTSKAVRAGILNWWAKITPEERSASALKGAETRRVNTLKKAA